MEIILSDRELEALMKETLVTLLTEKKDILKDILSEIMEDIAFGYAIKEAEDDEFVDEKEIMEILRGNEK